jgi:dolichol-phosphate mannosyltransferase
VLPPLAPVLVVIPTYNEAGNVEPIVSRVLQNLPDAHVLVVDDGSPDGTGALADRMAESDRRVHVLHRTEKAGLGAAYVAAFRWALQRDYGYVCEFDADGSHPADALPRIRAAFDSSARPGLVIGSRWVRGGSVVDWPLRREVLSRGANLYARVMLQVPVHDATAGFRMFAVDTLRALDLDSIDSKGYCFQIDLTVRAHDLGVGIVEVPIEFREREVGESKMDGSIIVEAMTKVTVWGVERAWRRMRARSHRPV